MKTKIVLTLSTPFIFSLLTACKTAPVDQPSPTLANQSPKSGKSVEIALKNPVYFQLLEVSALRAGVGQVLQQGSQVVGAVQAMQSGSLTDLLMQRVGVSQAQAQGGAGALFQIAKSQMQASAFSKLEQAIPGMGALLGAAPQVQQSSALGGLAGLSGLGGASGSTMLTLASAFQQQGMSPSMIQQFVPVVLEYVKGSGGNGLASSLSSALIGQ